MSSYAEAIQARLVSLSQADAYEAAVDEWRYSGDSYFLKGDFQPFETDALNVYGVIVRKQEDHLATN